MKKIPEQKPIISTSQLGEDGSKPWKVMIYIAADNNLKEESVYAVTEMLRAETKESGVTVVAQLDTGEMITFYDFDNDNLTEEKNEDSVKVPATTDLSVSKIVKPQYKANLQSSVETNGARQLNETTNGVRRRPKNLNGLGTPLVTDSEILFRSSDSDLLRSFLNDQVDPERSNLVVLSGHGDGAVGDFLTSNNPPSALSIQDLRSVLDSAKGKLGHPIEIVGMDSCLMSMIEVGYELRDSALYLVGAEGFARNAGWPYNEILSAMKEDPTIPPDMLSRQIVKEYIQFYAPYTVAGVSVDQTALSLESMEALESPIRNLATLLSKKLIAENATWQEKQKADPQAVRKVSDRKVENAVLLAHWRAQSYKLEQYVDLKDFCELLRDGCEDGEVVEACNGILDVFKQVVLLSCYSGSAFQYSQGLSIYFPWTKADLDRTLPFYEELAFAKATRWGEFLRFYGDLTQREPRPKEKDPNKKGKGTPLPMSIETDIGGAILAGRVRTNLLQNTRTNLLQNTRTNLLQNTRTNLLQNTRTNLLQNTRFGGVLVPMVKNPPDTFFKYEDDCEGEGTGGATAP